MKAKKLNKKLVLNKKTMSNLDAQEMNRIHGGKFTFDFPTCYYSCHTCFCP